MALGAACTIAAAVPLTPEEIASTCAGADGLAHCGRLIEAIQLKRLPGLAVREGDALHVSLFPSGRTSFQDAPEADRAYSLWDYLDPVNIAVIYVAHGDEASFLLLQRANARTFELPAEPKLAPDRQRIVTADFCAQGCRNEVAIWRVDRQGIQKESTFAPREPWADATARWKSADVVVIDYTPAQGAASSLERRLADPGWVRSGKP